MLPLAETQSSASFNVRWEANDIGSGVRDVTICVSDNGGPFSPWLSHTADTQATFTGLPGHTYAFYSMAQDNAHNIEPAHFQPDAMTTVIVTANNPPTANAGPDQTVECQGAQTGVMLDGTESSDPDGDPLNYEWREGETLVGTGATVEASLAQGSHTMTLTVTDPSGASAQDTVVIDVVDPTPPALTCPPDITQGNDPGQSFATLDPGMAAATDACEGAITPSGVRSDGKALTDPYPVGITTIAWTAKDSTGNTASGNQTITVNDVEPPVLTVPGDIAGTATSSTGAIVFYTVNGSDNCSGVTVNASPPSGSPFPLGETTVTCTATDDAGNTATKSFKVTVTYSWSGVLQPINADGSSVFKAGSTMPVKFQLTGASAGITDAVARLSYAKVSDGVAGEVNEAASTSAASTGNQFRYDAESQQYIFNWSTKGLAAGTYRLQIDLGDGVPRLVNLGLK